MMVIKWAAHYRDGIWGM